MSDARTALVSVLTMIVTAGVAEGAEPRTEMPFTAPAVVRNFDHGLNSGFPQRQGQLQLPGTSPRRYGGQTDEYSARLNRSRPYLGTRRTRWPRPGWARYRNDGRWFAAQTERDFYQYGYAPRPYYNFYDRQRMQPDPRSEWRYGWRSEWRPQWRSDWRRY